MLTRIQAVGSAGPIYTWVWGIFMHNLPLSGRHSRVNFLASDGTTITNSFSFPADTPAKVMFTNPIKFDGGFITATDEIASAYSFSYLMSPSPQYDK